MLSRPLYTVGQLVIYIDNLDSVPYCLVGRIVEVHVPEEIEQEVTYMVRVCPLPQENSFALHGFEYTEFRESQIYSLETIQSEVTKYLSTETSPYSAGQGK